jgi:hypothetical protein
MMKAAQAHLLTRGVRSLGPSQISDQVLQQLLFFLAALSEGLSTTMLVPWFGNCGRIGGFGGGAALYVSVRAVGCV